MRPSFTAKVSFLDFLGGGWAVVVDIKIRLKAHFISLLFKEITFVTMNYKTQEAFLISIL